MGLMACVCLPTLPASFKFLLKKSGSENKLYDTKYLTSPMSAITKQYGFAGFILSS